MTEHEPTTYLDPRDNGLLTPADFFLRLVEHHYLMATDAQTKGPSARDVLYESRRHDIVAAAHELTKELFAVCYAEGWLLDAALDDDEDEYVAGPNLDPRRARSFTDD